jgi:hypothetical protein
MRKHTCKGRNKRGKPCGAPAGQDGLCALHANPSRAVELGREGGRKNRHVNTDVPPEPMIPPSAPAEVKLALGRLMSEVYGRQVDTKVATCLVYTATALLKAMELSDLDERLRKLEVLSNAKKQA